MQSCSHVKCKVPLEYLFLYYENRTVKTWWHCHVYRVGCAVLSSCWWL